MKRFTYTAFLLLVFGLFLVQAASTPSMAAEMNGVDIHGFASQGYMISTDDVNFMVPETEEGTLEFNEVAINFSSRLSNLSENLTIGAQLMAFDFGNIGNNEVQVDWAYGDYAFSDEIGLRAGVMKMPFGLYNETRKVDMIRPSVFLPSSVYPEMFRESAARLEGAGLYGTLFDSLSYTFVYGQTDLDEESGMAYAYNAYFESLGMPMTVTDIELDASYSAVIHWDTPLTGLKVGASYMAIDFKTYTLEGTFPIPTPVYDNGGNPTGDYVYVPTDIETIMDWETHIVKNFSLEYILDRLTVAAEYNRYESEFTLSGLLIPVPQQSKFISEGYYLQASYRVLDNLEVGAYYSEYYFDKDFDDDEDWQQWLKETCLSVRYDINDSWCAKVEAHKMAGGFLSFYCDPDKHWQMYCAKLSYMF